MNYGGEKLLLGVHSVVISIVQGISDTGLNRSNGRGKWVALYLTE